MSGGSVVVLVVAALPEEIAYVRDVETLVTGVGKALAAAGLAHRLATGPSPDVVLNVGTAGALDASYAGVHEVDVVTQHDFPYPAIESLVSVTAPIAPRAFVLGRSSAPESHPVLPPPGAELVVLATGDTFVADAAAAARVAALGAHLVDMEAYAYAAVCHAFGVSMRCVKVVSDAADTDAAGTWLDTIDGCARSLAEWVGREYGERSAPPSSTA